MADVLEEITSQDITKDHVVRRIDDWLNRIGKLFASVETWLPSGWRIAGTRTVKMDSDIMRRFGVEPRQIPALDMVSPDGRKASIEPEGLWIVGANGRLDLFYGHKHFVISDRAENFAPPDWKIADFDEPSKLQKLDKETFLNALAQ
jgi:hypothetical protein